MLLYLKVDLVGLRGNMKYLFLALTIIATNAQVVMNAYRFGSGSENNNLLPQLIAFWSLDETSGYAVDSNTNAFHLTQYGTVSTNTGKIDGSRHFGGTLNGFYTNNATFANLDTNDFTIAVWFKPDSAATTGYIVAAGDLNGGNSWSLTMSDAPSLVTYVGGRDFLFTVNGFPADALHVAIGAEAIPAEDEWYFGYIKRSGDNFEIGVANPDETTITYTDTYSSPGWDMPYNDTVFSMGTALFSGSPIEEWQGELDHIGIWQRALSECELLKLLRLRKFSQFDSDACN
jgi:hypothetical protein